MNYENRDDLEKVADMVIVNVKHTLTQDELDQQGQQLAQSVNDKVAKENEKKVIVADFTNKIKELEAKIKVHAGYISSGFMMVDRTAEMYRDYARAKRVYFDKASGMFLKEEDFQHGDYQKKLDFEQEEERLRQEDIDRQIQIEENNRAGDHAEAALDSLDEVILDKKKTGRGTMKPVPKNNLPDDYGKNQDQGDELPDGMYIGHDGNVTDIKPSDEDNLPDDINF